MLCEFKDERCVLLGGKVYLVGRKESDILIPGDATVSRKHAEISLSHDDNTLNDIKKRPIIKLKDLSKFGTWVNNQKVEGERMLKDGDTVYFGSPKSTYKVVHEALVVASSCLQAASKKSVRQALCTLGGHMVNEWTKDCSILIMDSISVTVKVICALVSQKYIVTPDYLEHLIKHLQGTMEKPDPSKFIPILNETQLDPNEVSFEPDIRRATVFKDMKFYFLNPKQHKKMCMAIELAGGKAVLLEKKISDKHLVGNQSVVMTCTEAECNQSIRSWFNHVTDVLESNGRHMITDAEIGYAVLYCSTEKHCNPEHVSDTELSKLPSQSLSQVDPLLSNTQHSHRQQTQPGKSSQKYQDVFKRPQAKLPAKSSQGPSQSTKIKEEKITQSPRQPASNSQSQNSPGMRKRGWDLDDDDDDEEELRNVFAKRVKSEPVTPKSSQSKTSAVVDSEETEPPLSLPQKTSQETTKSEKGDSVTRKSVKSKPTSKANSGSTQLTAKSGSTQLTFSPHQKNTDKINNAKTKPVSSRGLTIIELDSDDEDEVKGDNKCASNEKNKTRSTETTRGAKRTKVADEKSTEHKRSRVTRSRSPSPVPSSRQTKVADEKSTEHKRSRVTKSRSPSPVPSSRQTKIADEKSPEHKRSRATRSRSPSPVPSSRQTKIADEKSPEHKRSRATRSRSPSPVPSSRHRKRAISPAPNEEVQLGETQSVVKVKKELESPQDKDNRERSRKDRDGQLSEPKIETGDGQLAEPKIETEEAVIENDDGPSVNDTEVPTGFLSSHRPLENQGRRNVQYIKEEDLPSRCIQIEYVSLVARRPKPKTTNSDDCPDGFVRWKGKVVRNFKKFRKVSGAGSQGLPRIIGGSDLEVHVAKRSREIDDWFTDSMQVESQESAEDRRAMELFNFEPSSKRRGR